MSSFGRTAADEEAGDVVFDEVLIDIGEQVVEALISATLRA